MRVFPPLIGTAVGLVMIASQSYAQDYPPPPDGPYYGAPAEEVIVTPPHQYVPERSAIGAPIVDVALSREVPLYDLDLRTDWGARELRSRISFTATALCSRLNAMYPVSADNSGGQWPRDSDCYRNAMRDAMAQAHQAIRAARGYGGY